MSSPSGQSFFEVGTGSTDYNKKPNRISVACNQCRRRKIRCDGVQPSCGPCRRTSALCVTTHPRQSSTKHVPRQTTSNSHCDTNLQESGDDTIQIYSTRTTSRNGQEVSDDQGGSLSIHSRTNAQNGKRRRVAYNDIQPENNLSDVRRQTTSTVSSEMTRQTSSPLVVQNYSTEDPSPLSLCSPGERTTMAVNTDQTSFRRQYLGPSSLQVFSQWLDISFFALATKNSLFSYLQYGMQWAVEFDVPLDMETVDIPPVEVRKTLFDIYFSRIHPLVPLLNEADFRSMDGRISTYRDLQTFPRTELPSLICLYLVLSIAADEQHTATSEIGTRYLNAAYSLYPHLVALPYMASVQGLLLLTIALRGRNKECSTFSMLGQAIRIAQSMGLHRKRIADSGAKADRANGDLDSHVWWTAYCHEKLMALDTGRPSMIDDRDIDQDLPSALEGQINFLGAWVGLAQLQSEICDRIFRTSERGRPDSVLHRTGQLDRRLLQWAESTPEPIRPDRDTFCCPPTIFPFAAFLAFQYHQTVATLHRAALILETGLYQSYVDHHCINDSWHHKLRASESVCVGSARSMVKVLQEMLQNHRPSRLLTLSQPLMATYVLAIQVIKHPWTWSAQSDLVYLETLLDYDEKSYCQTGIDSKFCDMLENIRALARKCVSGAKSTAPTGISTSQANQMPNDTVASERVPRDPLHDSIEVAPPADTKNIFLSSEELLQRSQDFSSLWSLPFEGDLLSGNPFDEHFDMEEARRVLGLPLFDEKFDLC